MAIAAAGNSINNANRTTLNRSLCWQVTARCNLKCPFCLSKHTRPKAELSTHEAMRVVDIAAAAGVSKLTFSGGEPLLRPDTKLLIRKALDLGFGCCLSTNGIFLTDDWLDFLAGTVVRARISLDGPKSIHNSIRAAETYDDAIHAIKRAVAAEVNTEINSVLTPLLFDCLEEFLDFSRSLQVKRVNFLTFWKEAESSCNTSLEISNQQLCDTSIRVERYLDRQGYPFTVRINDYQAEDRQKLVIEPDGELVGYSQSVSSHHYGSILTDGVLLNAISCSTSHDAIEIVI
jgi:MoaA/NifB/PqqE/SkfB family radical SAM enzyme